MSGSFVTPRGRTELLIGCRREYKGRDGFTCLRQVVVAGSPCFSAARLCLTTSEVNVSSHIRVLDLRCLIRGMTSIASRAQLLDV